MPLPRSRWLQRVQALWMVFLLAALLLAGAALSSAARGLGILQVFVDVVGTILFAAMAVLAYPCRGPR
jgi:hypothetical protein